MQMKLRPIRTVCFLATMIGVAAAQPEPSTQPAEPEFLLTKHENVKFVNQTVYISGQAFINCEFVGCTLVVRDVTYHLDKCVFERCNWHIDLMLLWGGDREKRKELRALLDMLDGIQGQNRDANPP